MVRKNNHFFYESLIIVLLVAVGCSPPYENSKAEREKRAKNNQGDIVVGVVWPNDDLFQGIDFAVQEINNSEKGVFGGRKIQIVQNREENSIQTGFKPWEKRKIAHKIANSFASNPDIVAVIGHSSSTVAIPASITYQYHGILFLSIAATNLTLTSHNFEYVFRLMPNNEEMGKQLAAFCYYVGKYKKMVVLNDRTSYGEELAESFIKSATDPDIGYKIRIVYHRSFFHKETNFRPIISELRGKNFDAIFLSTSSPIAGGLLIKQSREMGLKQPFIGGDALNSELALWDSSEGNAEGVVVPIAFNKNINTARQFIEQFKQQYKNSEPNDSTALGYDAMRLLVYAMRKAHSIEPLLIATRLRYMSPSPFWLGVTGVHQFQSNGEIRGKKYYFQKLRKVCETEEKCQGKFEFIPNAHLPYILNKIRKIHNKNPL